MLRENDRKKQKNCLNFDLCKYNEVGAAELLHDDRHPGQAGGECKLPKNIRNQKSLSLGPLYIYKAENIETNTFNF